MQQTDSLAAGGSRLEADQLAKPLMEIEMPLVPSRSAPLSSSLSSLSSRWCPPAGALPLRSPLFLPVLPVLPVRIILSFSPLIILSLDHSLH